MKKRFPRLSLIILAVIAAGCLACGCFATKDPAYMDLANSNVAPCRTFLFGTDAMGRDIFAMIWYGGRISLLIGFLATLISTAIAVLVGSISGYAPPWADGAVMRMTDLVLSVPGLLLTVFLQAVLGGENYYRLAVVIGLTSWMSMAKVVRTEVLQLKNTDYVLAARCLGGGFFHILCRHLAPNFVASLLFMAVMNVRNAIVAESTLSFMGMPSGGGGLLGKYALPVGECVAVPFVVDDFDTGGLSCDNAFLPDKSGKLYEKKRQ